MGRQDWDLLQRIDVLSPAEWAALAERARELGVGGSRWEDAWLAAGRGHPWALAAYSRAISDGAAPIAAAALAGAMAARQTRAVLTLGQYEALIRAVVETIAPGGRAPEAVGCLSPA